MATKNRVPKGLHFATVSANPPKIDATRRDARLEALHARLSALQEAVPGPNAMFKAKKSGNVAAYIKASRAYRAAHSKISRQATNIENQMAAEQAAGNAESLRFLKKFTGLRK